MDQAASRYIADLQKGDASDACSLETAETVRLQHRAADLFSRFNEKARSSCGLELLAAAPSDFPSTSTKLAPTRTSVTGDTARVGFPAHTLSSTALGDGLALKKAGGRWQIDAAVTVRTVQTPQAVAGTETLFFSQECLSAWNSALSSGQVTVPTSVETPSTAAWAFLTGVNSGVPCTSMSIDDPSAGYCQTYVQNASDGTWLQESCVSPPPAGSLQRDVWLGTGGIAIPAALQSPDGSVPALVAASDTTPASPSQPNAAPSLQVGPATNRVLCTHQVDTQGGQGGNCAIAEAAFTALRNAYRQTQVIPAHITVKAGASGQTTQLSCDVRATGSEVDCLGGSGLGIVATFFTSDVKR